MDRFEIDARRLHPEERETLARIIGHLTARDKALWFCVVGFVVIIAFCGGYLLGAREAGKEAIRSGHAEYVGGEFRWKDHCSPER